MPPRKGPSYVGNYVLLSSPLVGDVLKTDRGEPQGCRREVDAILREHVLGDRAAVVALSNQFRGLGAFQDTRFTGLYYNFGNGSWTLNGQAWYAKGTAFFNIRLIRQGDDWKLEAFHIRSPSFSNRRCRPRHSGCVIVTASGSAGMGGRAIPFAWLRRWTG